MALLFNMGVPMIMPTIYFMVLALIPIVLIETTLISKFVSIRFTRAIGPVAFANIVSTVVGLPLTWLLLFIIQMITGGLIGSSVDGFARRVLSVTLQAAWVPPFSKEEFWMFHLAALFLLIPFFFATWLIEYVMVRDRLAIKIVEAHDETQLPVAERKVFRAVRNANLLSYGLIALFLVASLILMSSTPR